MRSRSILRIVPLLAAVLLRSFTAYADEGMWMVHAISKALEADMKAKGLKLNANEIYNADAEGTSLKASFPTTASSSPTIIAHTVTCIRSALRSTIIWRTDSGP